MCAPHLELREDKHAVAALRQVRQELGQEDGLHERKNMDNIKSRKTTQTETRRKTASVVSERDVQGDNW